MDDTDALAEEIIACARREEIEDTADWVNRHRAQAQDENDINVDDVDVSGGDAVCVAYEPEPIDITYPEKNNWGEDIREALVDALYASTLAGVNVPVRTGCDRVWGSHTDLGKYDGETGEGPTAANNYYMAYTTVCMTPAEFLRIQYSIARQRHGESTQSDFADWLADTSEKRIQEIRDAIQDGTSEEWPRPPIELDRNGDVVTIQEGRHRGLAAYKEDVPYMDVYVFANHDTTRGKPEYKYGTPPEFPSSEV